MLAILIPGLIIVALMVWASTRIKKMATAAFEAETIETDDFTIQKPEGFLNNLNGDPKHTFEIYSKELGAERAEDFRQGRADLTILKGKTIDNVVSDIKDSDDEIAEDITEVIGSTHYRVIDATQIATGIEFRVTYKIAEKDGETFVLKAIRLAETSDEFSRKIEAFVASFELK